MPVLKIASWNMQGGSFAKGDPKTQILKDLMNIEKADFILIQEATEPLPTFNELKESKNHVNVYKKKNKSSMNWNLRHNDISDYHCHFHEWGEGNTRCSLAVYCRYLPIDYGIVPNAHLRPMLVLNYNNIVVGNVHLISGVPRMAWDQLKYFRHKMNTICNGKKCFIAGDFNMDFSFINDMVNYEHGLRYSFPPDINSFYHLENVATQQSGGILDYVLCEDPDIRVKVSLISDFSSDHRTILANIQW